MRWAKAPRGFDKNWGSLSSVSACSRRGLVRAAANDAILAGRGVENHQCSGAVLWRFPVNVEAGDDTGRIRGRHIFLNIIGRNGLPKPGRLHGFHAVTALRFDEQTADNSSRVAHGFGVDPEADRGPTNDSRILRQQFGGYPEDCGSAEVTITPLQVFHVPTGADEFGRQAVKQFRMRRPFALEPEVLPPLSPATPKYCCQKRFIHQRAVSGCEDRGATLPDPACSSEYSAATAADGGYFQVRFSRPFYRISPRMRRNVSRGLFHFPWRPWSSGSPSRWLVFLAAFRTVFEDPLNSGDLERDRNSDERPVTAGRSCVAARTAVNIGRGVFRLLQVCLEAKTAGALNGLTTFTTDFGCRPCVRATEKLRSAGLGFWFGDLLPRQSAIDSRLEKFIRIQDQLGAPAGSRLSGRDRNNRRHERPWIRQQYVRFPVLEFRPGIPS